LQVRQCTRKLLRAERGFFFPQCVTGIGRIAVTRPVQPHVKLLYIGSVQHGRLSRVFKQRSYVAAVLLPCITFKSQRPAISGAVVHRSTWRCTAALRSIAGSYRLRRHMPAHNACVMVRVKGTLGCRNGSHNLACQMSSQCRLVTELRQYIMYSWLAHLHDALPTWLVCCVPDACRVITL
jgi:hypothetical protein